MEWQPIQTAPKDGRSLDLWIEWAYGDAWREPDCHWQKGDWQVAENNWGDITLEPLGERGKATHWMPKPDAPTDKG